MQQFAWRTYHSLVCIIMHVVCGHFLIPQGATTAAQHSNTNTNNAAAKNDDDDNNKKEQMQHRTANEHTQPQQ